MRTAPHLILLAAAFGAAAIGLAPSADGSDGRDCLDPAMTSLCHKPTRGPTSSGGPDPAMQQLLGGNMANPTPPMAAIG